MDTHEFKDLQAVFLHPSRHSDSELSDAIGKALAQLPADSPELIELSETLLHRWRHDNAAVSAAYARLILALKPST